MIAKHAMKWILASLLVAAPVVAAPGPGGMTVTAHLARTSVLPYVPVEIDVTITNSGADSIYYTRTAVYEVTPERGEAFLANLGPHEGFVDTLHDSENDPDAVVELTRGQRRTHYVPTRLVLTGPGLFCDARLAVPGRYSIRVGVEQISTRQRPKRVSGWTSDPALFSPALRWSAPVELRVIAPNGADAVVSEKLEALRVTACDWSSRPHAVARMIWESHRDSTYAQYAAGVLAVENRDDALLETALALGRDPIHAQSLRLHAAGKKLNEKELRELIRTGSESIRNGAQYMLDNLLDDRARARTKK